MVTLITEKLQNQSLDDLARKSYDAGPVSCPAHVGGAAWAGPQLGERMGGGEEGGGGVPGRLRRLRSPQSPSAS